MTTRVLVVEDDAETLAFLMELVRAWGYQVDGARSGDEALRRMDATCPDIVLSDLMMPGMSGLDLLREIRGRREACPVFFVLITGHASVAVGVQAIEDGADQCLLKPVNPDVLKAILDRQAFSVTT